MAIVKPLCQPDVTVVHASGGSRRLEVDGFL
jgi:hypothetical protein